MSGISILCNGNLIRKLRNIGDFHPLKRYYNRKTLKRSKISIGNVGKTQICPSQMSNLFPITLIVFFLKYFLGGFFSFCLYNIQHCFICSPSDSTVPTDAGIEPRTVATCALAVRRSNH
jgi:hypothetical protein